MIDNHKGRRRFLHVAHISGFIDELNMMIFVLKIFLDKLLLTHTFDVIIHDVLT